MYTHILRLYQYYRSNIDEPPPDLQYQLFDIKDQLRSHPESDQPTNVESAIWRDYKFPKVQALVLTDTPLCNFNYAIVR